MNNQGSSSTSRATAQLSPEDRRAITLGLCEYGNAQMLTDAGRAAQNARYVGGEKPVRKPVNANANNNNNGGSSNTGGQGQGK
ncbi:MAG: hypothetical protein LQ338_008071 [Usnochroma carphineum]|nr:MAG: hypothetical protein LQ338_008071 [Usnochroma carphineum]